MGRQIFSWGVLADEGLLHDLYALLQFVSQ